MKKKILIVSGAAGTGHIRAAEALKQTIESDYPDFEVKHIDVLDYSDWVLKKTIASGYNFIARHLPGFYRLLYKAMDISDSSAEIFDIFLDLFKINVRKFNKFVKQYDPDHIICTFFLVPPLLEKKFKKATIDFIMTDYDVNNICISPVVRYFFTPDKEFTEKLNNGNKKSFAFGIPIDPEYLIKKDKEKIKEDFELNKDFSTVLITAGGIGLVDPTLIVKNILQNLRNINLVVITGKGNKRLKNKILNLEKNPEINTQIIEYTDKFNEIMRASDIIITKPGGLTVTEALFLKKPIIFYSPIPGQEEANAKYLEKNNLGLYLNKPTEASQKIKDILDKKIILNTKDMQSDINKKIIDKVIGKS